MKTRSRTHPGIMPPLVVILWVIALATVTGQPAPSVPAPEAKPGATGDPGSQRKTGVSIPEKEFLRSAAAFSLAELELAGMGRKPCAGNGVQELAGHLAEAHAGIHEDIKRTAAAGSVDLPLEPSLPQKTSLARLEREPPDTFDQRFVIQVMTDHMKAVLRYEKISRRGLDREMRAFAERTLPVLRMLVDEAFKQSGAGAALRKQNAAESVSPP